MGFPRQEYWSGLPFPSPGDLPNPGIEPRDRTQVPRIAGRRFILWATKEAKALVNLGDTDYLSLITQSTWDNSEWDTFWILTHYNSHDV